MPAISPHRSRSRRLAICLVTCAWIAAMAAAAVDLLVTQSHQRAQVRARLEQRVASGAEFASLLVDEIFGQEQEQARLWLRGRPTAARLRVATAAVGSAASVLLNRDGELLQVLPARPSILGEDMAVRYAHLRTALAGGRAASNVVPSAARGVPVVALAVPFPTPAGRRVFSVAFGVSHTPLGAFVARLLVTPGRRVYLVDGAGHVIDAFAASAAEAPERLPAQLATAAHDRRLGTLGKLVFARAAVSGTPWEIVATVPTASLYSTLDGAGRTLAWVALLGLALAGLVIIAIGAWLVRSRERLAFLARELDRLARIDALTGISNRRDLEETMKAAVSAARRTGAPLSVLLIDIDHFKAVNDTFGHEAGDAVIVAVAGALRDSLRVEDIVGRWGGEEFLAILPGADADAAGQAAERLRRAIARHPLGPAPVTVTVGAASFSGQTEEELVARADAALYAGKKSGRNTVRLAAAPDHAARTDVAELQPAP